MKTENNKTELYNLYPLSGSILNQSGFALIDSNALAVNDPVFAHAGSWTPMEITEEKNTNTSENHMPEKNAMALENSQTESSNIMRESYPDIEKLEVHKNESVDDFLPGQIDMNVRGKTADAVFEYSNKQLQMLNANQAANSYLGWLQSLEAQNQTKLPKAMESTPKSKKAAVKKPKSVVEQSIDASIQLGEEVISETLAKILLRQGHLDQAIAMYEKLAIKYPEKGAIFAATIKKIKS